MKRVGLVCTVNDHNVDCNNKDRWIKGHQISHFREEPKIYKSNL